MRGQWLHVPRDWPSVPGLEPVLMRDLDPEFIQSQLGELLRMAASINDGYGSATFLLERFGSAARNSKLHRAGTQLSTSVFCGQYFSNSCPGTPIETQILCKIRDYGMIRCVNTSRMWARIAIAERALAMNC